jgi:hypothetical protein
MDNNYYLSIQIKGLKFMKFYFVAQGDMETVFNPDLLAPSTESIHSMKMWESSIMYQTLSKVQR